MVCYEPPEVLNAGNYSAQMESEAITVPDIQV